MAKKPTKKSKAPVKAAAKPKASGKGKGKGKAVKSELPAGSSLIGKVKRLPRKEPRKTRKPLTYRGATLDPNLEVRIRALREKYRKAGRIVSFEYILDWYFQTEDEFCANTGKPYDSYSVWKAEWPFSYEYIDLVSEDIIYDEPEYNTNLDRLFRFIEERGKDKIRLYIRGVGENKARRYGINAGLSKVVDENALIAQYWKAYWDEVEETSPQLYRIPICYNPFTGVFFIDFNKTDFVGMSPRDWAYEKIVDEKSSRYQTADMRDEKDSGWGKNVADQYPKDKKVKRQKKKAEKIVKVIKDKKVKSKSKKSEKIRSVIMEKETPAAKAPKKAVKKAAKKAVKKAAKKAVVRKIAPVRKKAVKAVSKPTAAEAKALIRQLEAMGYVILKPKKATKADKPAKAVKKAVKKVAKKSPGRPVKAVKAVKKVVKKATAKVAKKGPGRPKKAVSKKAVKTVAKRGPSRPPKAPVKKVGRPRKSDK
jgi:hypothetical protein